MEDAQNEKVTMGFGIYTGKIPIHYSTLASPLPKKA